jgi:hypothetical protein
MALAGGGAIIIWNDIAPEGRADFYDWHIREHIPERLGVPGFLRGSRYAGLTADTKPEFLTLYETDHAAVATSAAYLARLNAPTDWTKRATAHFRNTSRALTTVVHSEGPGQGGVMGTLRFDGGDGGRAALDRVSAPALATIARLPRITGVHLCTTDSSASAARTAESRGRADILAAPIGAVLIEGCDTAAVRAAALQLAGQCALHGDGFHAGLYALEYSRMAR